MGIGLRLAQQMGAHRRATYKTRNIANETLKRTFWYSHPCLFYPKDAHYYQGLWLP